MFRLSFRLQRFLTKCHGYWRLVLALVLINLTVFSYKVALFERHESLVQTDKSSKAVKKSSQETSPQENPKIPDSSGFILAFNVQERCRALTKPYMYEFPFSFLIQRMPMIGGDSQHRERGDRSIYCPVEKVGSTFWRRVIYQANYPWIIRQPYQVSINMALGQKFHYPEKDANADTFKHFFKFLFVRNPFHRVLSAYIDKTFVPNPQFWDTFGKYSIQMFRANDSRTCYHDATFAEFVQFVVWSIKHLKQIDPHFLPATQMCVPCSMEYSFIGKMETFSTDIYPVLETLHLERAIPVLKTELKGLSDLDAIEDSILSPYSWQTAILKCMDWNEALQRVWRKLQMRGLIDMDKKLPLTKTTADKISREEFLEMAKQAWKASDPVVLKQQKKDMFIEMYRSVPMNILHEFVKTYHIDFYLFEYSPFPKEVFNRTLHFTGRQFVNFRN